MENIPKEAHLRSLAKAVSWRVFATLMTMLISYIVTGNAKFALTIGSVEAVAKIALYYFHERLWASWRGLTKIQKQF